jgi:hypothetical protein
MNDTYSAIAGNERLELMKKVLAEQFPKVHFDVKTIKNDVYVRWDTDRFGLGYGCVRDALAPFWSRCLDLEDTRLAGRYVVKGERAIERVDIDIERWIDGRPDYSGDNVRVKDVFGRGPTLRSITFLERETDDDRAFDARAVSREIAACVVDVASKKRVSRL